MVTSESEAEQTRVQVLNKMMDGFMASQALHVAAKLGIPDCLHERPMRSEEIAQQISAHEPSLRRLLGYLSALDLLTQAEDGTFTATPMGEMLRLDHPRSIRPWALLLGAPIIWGPWGDLCATVMSGQPAFDRIYGEPFFEHLAHSPEEAAVFNAAMTDDADNVSAVLNSYDFSGMGTIVDVGGGQGSLLSAILEKYPQARGILFDLPFVFGEGRERGSGGSDRYERVSGDMFQAVPERGDAYILKRIVHDWNDEESITILQNCRKAMHDGGRVLLIEGIVKPSETSTDLMMLLLVTGRERTEEEFRAIYEAAGFKLNRVIPAGSSAIIEGVAREA